MAGKESQLGIAQVPIRGTLDELDKDLAKARSKIEGSLSGTWKQIGGSVGRIGGAAVVGGLAAATAGAVALGGALASTIGPASDLQETVSKAGVVFGQEADRVLGFAKTSATALGMTQNEALAAAATYGNLFRAMGMGEATSADMSMGLVQLAADLASFNNQDPQEVLDALRSGLSGETEPLKRLGVNLNEAAVEAQAMKMGLMATGGELTAAAKAQATYALILDQTRLAQGDFARTSEGLANQQRILKATFGDLRAKIGTAVLPVVNKLATVLTSTLASPSVQKAIENISATLSRVGETLGTVIDRLTSGDAAGALETLFGPETAANIMGVLGTLQQVGAFIGENFQPLLAGLAAAVLAAVVPAFVSWATAAGAAALATITAAAPVIAIIAAVGVAVALLVAAWENDWGGIRTTLTQFWEETGRPILDRLRAWLEENVPKAIAVLSDFWTNTLQPALERVWGFIRDNLLPFLGSLAELVGAILYKAAEALAGLWQNVLAPALETVWDWLKKTADAIADRLQPVLEWLRDKALPPIERALGRIADAFGTASDMVGGWADKIRGLKLPWWLTPGSPTPLELGLLGIREAADGLTRLAIPRLQAELAFAPAFDPGRGGGGRAAGQNVYFAAGAIVVNGAVSAKDVELGVLAALKAKGME